METKLQKLKAFKQVSLTDSERSLMRAHAARIIMNAPITVSESFFKRGMQYGLRIALSSLLFLIFIGGSVSVAANRALPGDPLLYSFKRNVNEKVEGLIVGTAPEAQIAFQENGIGTRLQEIQTLANSNSLTPAKQAIAAQAITSQVADLSANLNTISSQSPSTALTVTASLEQTLKENKVALENTPANTPTETDGQAAAIQTVNTALQTVSNQEVAILSKEIDTINNAVTNVPTSISTTATVQTATQSPAVTPLTPVAP
jgi:hypothetical protein